MLPQRETPALYHEILDLVETRPAKAEPKKPRARRAYKPSANGKSLLDAVLEKSEKSYKAADRDLKALGNEKIDWMDLKEERRIAATHAYKALSPEKAKELGVYLCFCGAIVGRTHHCNRNTFPDGGKGGDLLGALFSAFKLPVLR